MELDVYIGCGHALYNLMLNTSKSMEMITYIGHGQNSRICLVPPPSLGVTRVTSMKILGRSLFTRHVRFCLPETFMITNVLSRCAHNWICPQTISLRAHGLTRMVHALMERINHRATLIFKTHLCISRMVWISGRE